MKESKLPKVSIVLLTFNGGAGVTRSLMSVRKQNYPWKKIEIIVADNCSSDDSVSRAKKIVKKIYRSSLYGAKFRAWAMRKATGEFVYMILEQDMEIKSRDFVRQLVKPLIEDETLVASFTREYPKRNMPWVTRFISYDPVQRDPLFQFLTPSIESTIEEKKKGYFICNYNRNKIPPTTHMLFRKSFLTKSKVWNQKEDFDHDTVMKLIKAGFYKFAYVPSAGMYHYHADSLKHLIDKRLRNLKNHFFPRNSETNYTWVDKNNKSEIVKLFFWVIYVNLFIPEALRGIFKTFKYKDWVLLAEPVIAMVVTDRILLAFLFDKRGRKIIFNLFNFLRN